MEIGILQLLMSDAGADDLAVEGEPIRKAHVREAVQRDHGFIICALFIGSLSLCIATDILQYSMPLAFLPSVLEDRGHSTIKIATAIGVYYWTGFLGGLLITSYQVWRVVRSPEDDAQGPTALATAKRGVGHLLIGLGVGTVTLAVQATWPRCHVHIACRFIQGLVGAFIFFYAFLLSVQLFRGRQQVIAMTSVSCALNVAEVMGSVLGAAFFESYGTRGVFFFLAGISTVNQGALMLMYWCLRPASPDEHDDAAILPAQSRVPPGSGFQRILNSSGVPCSSCLSH